ncbi:MAG: DUF1854 domain-containing protein [Verrucomicrobia bacterium]|nr:MAG: DUF1854 domain-containing protein [Verrucomicrobiota bacterium]
MNPPTAHFDLQRNAAGNLTFTDAAGVVHHDVLPLRLFPLTDPQHWVAITSATGHDLACIEDLAALSGPTRDLLLETLAQRDFVPLILSIHAILRAAHGYEWHVTTDRGKTHFTVENDESIQPLAGGSIVVMDHRNTRYLIPDPATLDLKSRQRLERYY